MDRKWRAVSELSQPTPGINKIQFPATGAATKGLTSLIFPLKLREILRKSKKKGGKRFEQSGSGCRGRQGGGQQKLRGESRYLHPGNDKEGDEERAVRDSGGLWNIQRGQAESPCGPESPDR
jgi:hypothetical protein